MMGERGDTHHVTDLPVVRFTLVVRPVMGNTRAISNQKSLSTPLYVTRMSITPNASI